MLRIASVYSRFRTANLITQERSVAAVVKGSWAVLDRRSWIFALEVG
jgi:hypothetical protein